MIMRHIMFDKKLIGFAVLLILTGALSFANFALADSCPDITTVSGTTVTFVGELTDTGGDAATVVWFEYGKSQSYGLKTSEKVLSQTGRYCVTVSNLLSCTTYHYRAAARNSSGTSYGENKSFTTTCLPASDILTVDKLVRNLSDGTAWLNSVSADPNEVISFRIKVKMEDSSLENVIIKDTLPEKVIYRGNLKIDNISSSGNIISGLNIGNLAAGQTKTITFDAQVAGSGQFTFGQTKLTNSALAYTTTASHSDTAEIIVSKTAVAGAATGVATGWTNNLFLDTFFFPLVIALILIWLLKSHIIKFEERLDDRKREYREYRSKKLLKLRTVQEKVKDSLGSLRRNLFKDFIG